MSIDAHYEDGQPLHKYTLLQTSLRQAVGLAMLSQPLFTTATALDAVSYWDMMS
jgi:hypothetical protein